MFSFGSSTGTATAPATGTFGSFNSGATPGATGGFGGGATAGGGAPATNSFTTTNTATNKTFGGGFGTGAMGGATGATAGFGTTAPGTGWGAGATAGVGGFSSSQPSSSTAGTFGQQQGAGWGTATANPTAPGIGSGGTTLGGGWGMNAAQPQQQAQQAQPQPVTLASLAHLDVAKQSAIGRYLIELDAAYSALSPKCKFRTFMYNMCIPGQGEKAIERERYIAAQAGGGCKDEEWVLARELNPDPENMYPAPVHFMQELAKRVKKQEEAIAQFHTLVDVITERAHRLKELQESNAIAQRKMEMEQVMLQRRWLSLLRKMELVRLVGKSAVDDQQEIGTPALSLHRMLNAPGQFKAAVADVQPFVDAEMARLSSSASGSAAVGGGGLLTRSVDAFILKQWVQYVERMQDGLEAMGAVIDKDLADVSAAATYVRNRSGRTY